MTTPENFTALESPGRTTWTSALREVRWTTAAIAVGGLLLLNFGSKLLGFVREVLISSRYGTGEVADLFFTLQQIPVFASVFIVGPFMLVFVPHYTALREAGLARQLLRRVISTSVLLATTGTVVMVGGALIISGIDRAGRVPGLAPTFAIILGLSLPPVCVAALAIVVLHAHARHIAATLVAGIGPAAMLGCLLILGALPLVRPAEALPWSATIGACLAALIGAVVLRRTLVGLPHPAHVAAGIPRIAGFRRDLVASALENVGFTANQTLTVAFAAGLGGGSVAVNAYAWRLAAFALSTVIAPLNQVLQTWMAQDRPDRRGRSLLAVFGGMALAVVLLFTAVALVSGPLTELIYLRGAFTTSDAARVTDLLAPYCVYGSVIALNQLLARYHFARGEGARYAATMIAAYIVANIAKALVAPTLGLPGVIWASALAEGGALLFLASGVVRREIAR